MRFGAAGPLGQFSACHTHTLEQCLALRELTQGLRETGWSTRALQASCDILRHFDGEVPRTRGDEEACLFPVLLDCLDGADAGCVSRLTSQLASEHGHLARMWAQLRPHLEAVATGRARTLPVDEVEAFIQASVDHVETEERGLLPMAARVIPGRALPRLRAAIAARHWDEPCL